MPRLRIGLIGAGKHGVRYARHIIDDIPELELVALARRDRDEGRRLAATFRCAYHADYHDLLADPTLDAVAVVVPPPLNAAIVDAACRARKHVLLEKPMAPTVAEAHRIRDAVAAAGVRCMIAHTLRFNTVVQALRARLGEIAPLHAIYLSQRFEPSPLAWLDCPAESGGGIVLHTGVHGFDLLRFFTGLDVEDVWCTTSRIVTRETEDNFVMTCRLAGAPLTGIVTNSRSTRSRSGLIEISGEGGQLLGDHAHNLAFSIKGLERRALELGPPAATVRETLRAFVTGVVAGTPFPITVEDGLRAVAVAEACYRSAAAGQPARVEV